MKISLIIVFFGFIILCSCHKEEGRYFLRVLPPSDSTITNLVVLDANGPVLQDTSYHPVSGYLEIRYVVPDLLQSQVKDWTASLPVSEFSYQDVHFNEFIGEYEKGEGDKYYTIIINYIISKDSEPRYASWGGYYYYDWDYYDGSSMYYTLMPER